MLQRVLLAVRIHTMKQRAIKKMNGREMGGKACKNFSCCGNARGVFLVRV